jgi:hypothetical protein
METKENLVYSEVSFAICTVQKACFSDVTSAVDRFITESILVFLTRCVAFFVRRFQPPSARTTHEHVFYR